MAGAVWLPGNQVGEQVDDITCFKVHQETCDVFTSPFWVFVFTFVCVHVLFCLSFLGATNSSHWLTVPQVI